MLHGWCHVKCCRFGASSVYTIQPCTRLQCHFIQSHIGRVYACLAVTCHLHFWHNDGIYALRTMLPNGLVVRHTVLPHRCAHRPRGKAGFASQDCSDSAQATLSTSTAGTSCYVPYSQTDRWYVIPYSHLAVHTELVGKPGLHPRAAVTRHKPSSAHRPTAAPRPLPPPPAPPDGTISKHNSFALHHPVTGDSLRLRLHREERPWVHSGHLTPALCLAPIPPHRY